MSRTCITSSNSGCWTGCFYIRSTSSFELICALRATMGHKDLLRVVCDAYPPGTGFKLRILENWDRARYVSERVLPIRLTVYEWKGRKHFFMVLFTNTSAGPADSLWITRLRNLSSRSCNHEMLIQCWLNVGPIKPASGQCLVLAGIGVLCDLLLRWCLFVWRLSWWWRALNKYVSMRK